MQINNHSNINFSSKINFVPYDIFEEYINPSDTSFLPFYEQKSVTDACDSFYSVQLRSCSGGGVVKPFEKSVGFHLYDCAENVDKAAENVEDFFVKNPDAERGLLIGGKDLPRAPHSLKQFDVLKENLLNKIKNLSIFQTHAYADSETNYHYSVDDDTWTINTQYSVLPGHPKVHDVDSLEKLKKAFKNIKIADGDELLINDIPVRKNDAPEFFEPVE